MVRGYAVIASCAVTAATMPIDRLARSKKAARVAQVRRRLRTAGFVKPLWGEQITWDRWLEREVTDAVWLRSRGLSPAPW